MNKFRLVILSIICLFSFISHGAEAINPVSRFSYIDENNALVSAYKTYIKIDLENPKNTITVQLIGVWHNAIPQFYKDVEKLMEGKIVLYELPGNTIETQKKTHAKLENLPSHYKEKLKACRGQLTSFEEPADALGQVSQFHCLSYDGCKELIHADAKVLPWRTKSSVDWETLDQKDFEIICEQGSEEDLKKFIDKKILSLMKYNNIPCDESNTDENLSLLKQKIEDRPKRSAEIISRRLRRYLEDGRSLVEKGFDCKKGRLLYENAFTPEERFIAIERNEFIFASLKELFNRPEILAPIAVVYGACHLPFVEEFLFEQGFMLLAGSEGWLTIAAGLRE
jgi:hypothetical protein